MILYDIQNDSFVYFDTSQVRLYGQELGGSIIDSLVLPFLDFYAPMSVSPISGEDERLISMASCSESVDAICDPNQPLFAASYQNVPILTLTPVCMLFVVLLLYRRTSIFNICEICSPSHHLCLIVCSFPFFLAKRFLLLYIPISLNSPYPQNASPTHRNLFSHAP